MDPITHSLSGVVLKNLGFKRKAALGVLFFASVAPDLDQLSRLWGAEAFLRYHRGFTHGIPAMVVVSILIGLIFGLRKGFFYYFFLSFLGYGTHLFLDLTNQYATRLMSPFDDRPFSYDLTFIIDPYISLGLLISAVIVLANKKRAAAVSAITLILLLGYIGGRYYLHGKTRDFLKTEMSGYSSSLSPLPNDFLRWWFVAKSKDDIKVGFADLLTKRVCVQETYKATVDDPMVEKSKGDGMVDAFLYFAKYPYPEVRRHENRIIITWRELAYSFMPGEHVAVRVVMDEEGRVLKSHFKF